MIIVEVDMYIRMAVLATVNSWYYTYMEEDGRTIPIMNWPNDYLFVECIISMIETITYILGYIYIYIGSTQVYVL